TAHTITLYKLEGVNPVSVASSSPQPGYVSQVAAFDSRAPIYVVGQTTWQYHFTEQMDLQGNITNHRDRQPAEELFPVNDGFYSWYDPSSTLFVEHYSAAATTYDWGRGYLSKSSFVRARFAAFKSIPSGFYLVVNVPETGIIVQRFG